jgi:hypothetical protein
MPLTGEEIRANLTRFVARWSVRDGYERGEAQTFLTELFDCYGRRLSDVAEFERFQAGGFVDLIWLRLHRRDEVGERGGPALQASRAGAQLLA